MALIEYIKLATAFFGAVGGAGIIIIGLAKWFGGFLSNRLLDSYNNKHEVELEKLEAENGKIEYPIDPFKLLKQNKYFYQKIPHHLEVLYLFHLFED